MNLIKRSWVEPIYIFSLSKIDWYIYTTALFCKHLFEFLINPFLSKENHWIFWLYIWERVHEYDREILVKIINNKLKSELKKLKFSEIINIKINK